MNLQTAELSLTANPTIEELVQQASQGDRAAFGKVYERCVDRVYALCLRMTGNAEKAEELVQDAFVRAWEKLGSFRGDSRFTTWLHRLTVNEVLRERRSRSTREKYLNDAPDIDVYSAAARDAFPGTRIDLEKALSRLPDRARQALVLRDIEGFKYREVAVMTGVAVGTVKAQVHRARQMMREALES